MCQIQVGHIYYAVFLRSKEFLISKATVWAVLLVIILILVMIAVSDTSPQWIYQGF